MKEREESVCVRVCGRDRVCLCVCVRQGTDALTQSRRSLALNEATALTAPSRPETTPLSQRVPAGEHACACVSLYLCECTCTCVCFLLSKGGDLVRTRAVWVRGWYYGVVNGHVPEEVQCTESSVRALLRVQRRQQGSVP